MVHCFDYTDPLSCLVQTSVCEAYGRVITETSDVHNILLPSSMCSTVELSQKRVIQTSAGKAPLLSVKKGERAIAKRRTAARAS